MDKAWGMAETAPALDRHVQDLLGDVLRGRLEDDRDSRLPSKLETLMATLGDEGRAPGSADSGR